MAKAPAKVKLLLFSALALLVLGGCWGLRQRTVSWEVREKEYLPLIDAAAKKHGLPPNLLRALVWQESRFDALAVGSCGEIGLTQIMDGAVKDWARYHRCAVPPPHKLFEPQVNLEIGAWYLSRAGRFWRDYASCEVLQLAEYNAGRTTVLRLWKPKDQNTPLSLEEITYPGTQNYIKAILRRKAYYDRQNTAGDEAAVPTGK